MVANQGGTSPGETFAIMQVLFFIAFENSCSVITVVGQDNSNRKRSVPLKNVTDEIKSLIMFWLHLLAKSRENATGMLHKDVSMLRGKLHSILFRFVPM